MDNSIILTLTIIIAITLGYSAHKYHWKIADYF